MDSLQAIALLLGSVSLGCGIASFWIWTHPETTVLPRRDEALTPGPRRRA